MEQLPFRTYTKKGHIPFDITNLIFIGSARAVERAFAASDWVQVDSLTAESTYATIRSVAENQGYKSAPMSTLLLGDQAPAYAYAKTLNTFSSGTTFGYGGALSTGITRTSGPPHRRTTRASGFPKRTRRLST